MPVFLSRRLFYSLNIMVKPEAGKPELVLLFYGADCNKLQHFNTNHITGKECVFFYHDCNRYNH
jgi:hypothetical protein